MEAAEAAGVSQLAMLWNLQPGSSGARRLQHIGEALMFVGWGRDTLLIHVAVEENCYELVRTILDEIKADINIRGGERGTAIKAAISTGDEKMVQLLLCHGADINAKDENYTPLLFAIDFRLKNIVRMLLEHGADVNTRSGIYGSPLHRAKENKHRAIIGLLLQYGAEDHPPIKPLSS